MRRPATQMERKMKIQPRYQTTSPLLAADLARNANETKLDHPEPKLHWSKELKQENERLKAALAYTQFQMRVIIQSRFDKYRNAKDTESTMAYRKAVHEIEDRLNGTTCVSQEILDGESKWNPETNELV